MKPTTTTIEAEAPAESGPSIQAMPDPQPNLLAELNEARTTITTLTRKAERLENEKAEIAERLKEILENPLIFSLSHLDAGGVLKEAGEELARVACAVRDLRENGHVTLKIKVRAMKGAAEALLFEPEVTAKAPKTPPEPGIFFSADDGKIQRNDPRQRELPLN